MDYNVDPNALYYQLEQIFTLIVYNNYSCNSTYILYLYMQMEGRYINIAN